MVGGRSWVTAQGAENQKVSARQHHLPQTTYDNPLTAPHARGSPYARSSLSMMCSTPVVVNFSIPKMPVCRYNADVQA